MSVRSGVLVDYNVEAVYSVLKEREEELVQARQFGKNLQEEKNCLQKEKDGLLRELHALQNNTPLEVVGHLGLANAFKMAIRDCCWRLVTSLVCLLLCLVNCETSRASCLWYYNSC